MIQTIEPQVRELEESLAKRIWRSVVPESLNEIPHYKSLLASRPAKQVGGDFHLSTGSWIIVGDVSGKGIPAALLTGMFIASLKLAVQHQDPGLALQTALYNELDKAEMFTTLVAVQLGSDGWIDYLNMGHPPVLVRRKRTEEIIELSASAPPMGTLPLPSYPVKSFRLEPGDTLCLYTDGITEAESQDNPDLQYGTERLSALLKDHEDFADAFAALLKDHENWHILDDYTLVMLEYCPDEGWLEERLERR
ncbi:MAG: serine/threonine-protein phosphatase [Trueperaceae bacterium]|nr:serine/threonine-protein phosphatase [Trueperaceae bacterium]